MAAKEGERVFVVESTNMDEVRLRGRGVHEGMHPCPLLPGNFPNPRIRLDDGTTVWGCEVWFGHERRFEEFVGGRKVVEVKS